MIKKLALLLLSCLPFAAHAQQEILNIYAYSGEIPDFVISQFERETGVKVNISTYENNEVMYAKLRAVKNPGYDIVMPSGYFIDRMRKQNMLEPINKALIPNWKNLNPAFLHPSYDQQTQFSMPYIWGVTGIFVNDQYYSEKNLSKWSDLWDERFTNKLMLLDDIREVFSMALLSLGYPANDTNPEHIKAAFLKLKKLMKNVKVFSSDTVISIIIDEDATVGMAWNGDAFKASLENKHVNFIYPKDGFVIWVDNMAIPTSAPHKATAHKFMNYVLHATMAREIALYTRYPTTNLAAQKLLPESVRNNPVAYPSKEVLKRGQFQTDIPQETRALLEKYWEELKMGG